MPASSSQPTTSLIAAEPIAMTPSTLRDIWNSSMMRPRIGSAVIAKAVPMKSAQACASMVGASTACETPAKPMPGTKGSASPTADTFATA